MRKKVCNKKWFWVLFIAFFTGCSLMSINFTTDRNVYYVTNQSNSTISKQSNLYDNSWESIFKCLLSKNISIIKSNNNQLCNHNKFNHLLSKTVREFNTNYTPNISYHELISLRRQIMISHYLLNINTNIINNKMYNWLLHKFMTFDKYYKSLAIRQKHKIFHIHISKSAGTSLRTTLRNYAKCEHQPCSNLDELFNLNCKQLYDKYSDELIYSRENVLFPGFGHLNQPILCDQFIYILPIRQPIERICSQLHEFSGRYTHFMRNYKSYKILHPEYKAKCDEIAVINGIEFIRLSNVSNQYDNIFVQLLQSENNIKYKQYQVANYDEIQKRIYKLSVDKKHIQKRNNCKITVPNFVRKRYFPFDISFDNNGHLNMNESEFVFATGRYNTTVYSGSEDVSWIRTKMGSNIYTSWLGYNESNRNNNGFLALSNYVLRESINYGHFVNAMDLMLKIDYVLPMEIYSKQDVGSIWNMCLYQMAKHLLSVKGEEYKLNNNIESHELDTMNIGYANSGKFHTRIGSKDICEKMIQQDKDILLKYNQFDLSLYYIARFIGIVDEIFYGIN